VATQELKELAKAIADWAVDAPLIVSRFVFGGRVRGDHRSDDDVDLSIDYGGPSDEAATWQAHNEETDYAALKSVLPGPLKLAFHSLLAGARPLGSQRLLPVAITQTGLIASLGSY
jgi:hypothetical protein